MNKTERADAAYKCFCEFADGANLKYKGDAAERNILIKVGSGEFSAPLLFHTDEENERICVIGKMPFEIKKEKVSDFIIAVNAINCELAAGAFCVAPEKNYCGFEMNAIFAGVNGFGKEFAERIMIFAFSAVEKYGRKLEELNCGKIGVNEFTEWVKEGI